MCLNRIDAPGMNESGAGNPIPKLLANRISAIRSRSWMTAAGWKATCGENASCVSRPVVGSTACCSRRRERASPWWI